MHPNFRAKNPARPATPKRRCVAQIPLADRLSAASDKWAADNAAREQQRQQKEDEKLEARRIKDAARLAANTPAARAATKEARRLARQQQELASPDLHAAQLEARRIAEQQQVSAAAATSPVEQLEADRLARNLKQRQRRQAAAAAAPAEHAAELGARNRSAADRRAALSPDQLAQQRQDKQVHNRRRQNKPTVRPEIEQLLDTRYDLVAQLVKDPVVSDDWHCPRDGVPDDVRDAAQFSQYMDTHLPLSVCAVCGMCRGSADLSTIELQDAAGQLRYDRLELLRRDGPKSAILPRSGLTVCRIGGGDYCLEAAGVKAASAVVSKEPLPLANYPVGAVQVSVFPGDVEVSMSVCVDRCLPQLQHKHVPKYSLVSFDAGHVPGFRDLVPLSPVEELIVAPLRVNRLTVIARPPVPAYGRTRDSFQTYLQGHIVAVPNVPSEALSQLVTPIHPDELAKYVEVVILSHAGSPEEAIKMARQVRCTKIRPAVVVAWVEWLRHVYGTSLTDLGIHIDEHVLAYYRSTHDISVPVSLATNLHVVGSQADAEHAIGLAAGIRAGYANTRPDVPLPEAVDDVVLPDVNLDCDLDAPLVTVQLTRPQLSEILACFPCVLKIPARPNPQAEDVLLPDSSCVVANMADLSRWMAETGVAIGSQLLRQLDEHVKAVVRQYQLSVAQGRDHMAGIEDMSVIVDANGATESELPTAVRDICADEVKGHRERGAGEDESESEGFDEFEGMPGLVADECESCGSDDMDDAVEVDVGVEPLFTIPSAMEVASAIAKRSRPRRYQELLFDDCYDLDFDGLIETDESETDDEFDPVLPMELCGDAVVDGVAAVAVVVDDPAVESDRLRLTRLRAVLRGEDTSGKIGIVAGRGAAYSEIDRRWPALTHPSVFPFGLGTPPQKMSYDAWLPVILQRYPPSQYAEQPMFVLDMFNVTQRAAVNQVTKSVLCADPGLYKEFAAMSAEDLVLASELFDSKLRGTAYSTAMARASPVVKLFLSSLKKINSKVRATPAYYASCRSQAFASWHATGPFTVFPTLNPSELHSANMMKLLKYVIEYDEFGEPSRDSMPTMVARWKAVAANPVACAQFFDVYRSGVWSVFYGWERGKTGVRQHNEDCRFGLLRAIVDRAECSSRGGLHDHGLNTQAHMQPWNLRKLQQTDHGRNELVKFARSLASKQLPAGWWLPESGDWVTTSDPAKEAVEFKKVNESGQLGVCYRLPVGRLHEDLLAAASTTGEAATAAYAKAVAVVEEFQARLIAANMVHTHTHRCQKGHHRGDDADCAMYKPEEAREDPEVLEGGCMLFKCDNGMLSAHCPALILVDPCNQAVVLCWDASRWRTQKLRAEQAGVEFELALPNLEMHVVQAANYTLKYITKKGTENADLAAVLVSACSSWKAVDASTLSADQRDHLSRLRVVQFLNKFNSKIVVVQSMCALLLMGKGDFFMTHLTTAYHPYSFAAALQERANPEFAVHMPTAIQAASTINVGGRLAFATPATDYFHRHRALCAVPAYFTLMCFDKVTARAAAQAPEVEDRAEMPTETVPDDVDLAAAGSSAAAAAAAPPKPLHGLAKEPFDFQGGHPQQMSHTMVLRSQLHLPQAIGNYTEEPAADAELVDKNRYAYSILSMLVPWEVVERLCQLGYEPWDIFDVWRCCEVPVVVAPAELVGVPEVVLAVGLATDPVLDESPVPGCVQESVPAVNLPAVPVVSEVPAVVDGLIVSEDPVVEAAPVVAAIPCVIGQPTYSFDLLMDASYCTPSNDNVDGMQWLKLLPDGVRPTTLKEAFGLLRQELSSTDLQLSTAYSRWQSLGQYVACNIQGLAAGQAADRLNAKYLKRSQMRQATGMQRAPMLPGESDDEHDDEDNTLFEHDAWAMSSAMDLPRDQHELLADWLTLRTANSKASKYAEVALSRVPPIDFGISSRQTVPTPAHSAEQYATKSAAKRAIEAANILQSSAAADQLAAEMSSGVTPYDLKHVGKVQVSGVELLHSGTPAVHARIEYLGEDNTPVVAELDAAVHGPPPNRKLPVRPTVVDTVLFTLSTEQAFAFVQLAETLQSELNGVKVSPPLRMVLTGEPGTGKSQVLKAFQWFALQYDASHMLLVAAFTWRAALGVATGKHPAMSTCKAFGINPFSDEPGDASVHLDGVRFVFIDEYSFIGCRHLSLISQAIRRACRAAVVAGASFGDLNVILCGDLCQHKPVSGLPLFSDNTERAAHNALLRLTGNASKDDWLSRIDWASKPEAYTGLIAYQKFNSVVFLQKQQRITAENDPLFAHSRLFMSEDRPSRSVVANFCDELNAKVVTPALLEQWAADGGIPRVVCLRNEIRKSLNWSLAGLHAKHLKARPIVWFSRDTMAVGAKLSGDLSKAPPLPQLVRDAIKCVKPEDTNFVPAVQMFFPGCLYTFNDNVAPAMGFVNNSECAGVGILLADGEEDDPTQSCWILKRPPLAVYVRPAVAKVSAQSWHSMRQLFPTLPEGCIPVCPAWTDQFKVKVQVHAKAPAMLANVRRFGISLSDAYAVTDYYCEGMSFGDARWMAHLCLPPDNHSLKRAAVFVVTTRFAAWDKLWLIAPLWPQGDVEERDRTIDAFHKLACIEPELKKELRRLRAAAEACKTVLSAQWQRAVDAAVRV